jgi:nucleotide-binding universal stress UspA family protein
MYTSVLVPLDGSLNAERALPVAQSVAARCNAPMRLISFVPSFSLVDERTQVLEETAARCAVSASVDVRHGRGWAVEDLAAAIDEEPGALVCMSSHGRGRTGALLGSVAEGVLRGVQGPCLLVGPKCVRDRIDAGDRLAIAVDDSPAADEVVGLGGSWAVSFDLEPWIVTSLDPAGPAQARAAVGADHVDENAGVHRLAARLESDIGREVDWEVLHGKHPAAQISTFAADNDMAVVVMGTHTTKGVRRLAVGSVCAATVHTAPCPVLTHRTTG